MLYWMDSDARAMLSEGRFEDSNVKRHKSVERRLEAQRTDHDRTGPALERDPMGALGHLSRLGNSRPTCVPSTA